MGQNGVLLNMYRSLNVQLKPKTWPNNTPPQSLQNLQGMQDVDIFAFMLMIGYCTVPSHSARHSINALWAWMRYFGALSSDSGFRLSDDFSELDPHQKTILSDDFGMGMSMHLMSRALGLQMFCDGKYFIDRLSHRVRCNITATKAKSGPRKSPDFVGVDGAGKWHIIECKGTQSGSGYGNRQLRDGVLQKNAIRFAASIRGETLVTGFEIARTDLATSSRFVIRDPEPEVPPLEIEGDEVAQSLETMARGKIARCLTLAGAPNLSRFAAAPFGDNPENLADTEIFQSSRERSERFRASGIEEVHRLTPKDGFFGREATFELPFRIETPKGTFGRARVKTEVSADVVDYWGTQAQSDGLPDDVLDKAQQDLAKGKIVSEADGTAGELRDGNLYRSQVNLLE